MPSSFEQMFVASSLPALYALHGRPATYTPPNGSTATPLTVRRNAGEPTQVNRETRVTGEMQTAEIMVQQSELAKPVKDGRFTVEGVEVWTIATMPVLKNGQWNCKCERAGKERMVERRDR